jgi:voltage-gated potassium channel
MAFVRQIVLAAAVLFGVVALGVAGIGVLENLSWADALYFVVITLASVGYGDIVPLTLAGKMFTVILVVVGFITIAYAFSIFTALQIRQVWGESRMNKQIAGLNKHYIVCGAGRVGEIIVGHLKHHHHPFVVIERMEEIIRKLHEEGVMALQGDATMDETLLQAGIERASGIITALSNDADNVYVTLTARSLNPNIKIVSRAARPEAEEKLKRAGAHSVIYPVVMDFIENVVFNKDLHLDIAEIKLADNSKMIGLSLRASGIKDKFDAIVVAIKRVDKFIHNPSAEEILHSGDVLILLGHRQQLLDLAEAAK